MKSNEGRLQSAEHVLCKVLETKIHDSVMGISKFNEESGLLEITTSTDPRELDVKMIEDEVNNVIKRNLSVHKLKLKREEAEKMADLRKVPSAVTEVTLIDIEGFDVRPCRDPHVNNTSEIGHFKILKVEKVGSNRFRFTFKVE